MNDRTLTPMQRRVLELLAAGCQSTDGAAALGVAVTTWRTHTQNLKRVLRVRTNAEAVAIAYETGILGLGDLEILSRRWGRRVVEVA